MKHPDSKIAKRWNTSGINEFARLFQGYGDTEGVDILEWIFKQDVPHGQRVTYPRYTVDILPEKSESYRTQITAGSNILEYFGDTTTHCASMETVKLHLNSILSTTSARYCNADISNMYLCSLLPDAQYVCFQYSLIPSEIIKHYNLDEKVVDGCLRENKVRLVQIERGRENCARRFGGTSQKYWLRQNQHSWTFLSQTPQNQIHPSC